MNSLAVIKPYRYLEMWVFDDERAGIVQEPFVGGADAIIDQWVRNIPNAYGGFQLVFSAEPFPGFQHRLTWVRPELSGNVYFEPDLGMEGWLCPALLKYFEAPPAELYCQCKPISEPDH